jgi:multiple sugar transport system ATP-binding protein
VGVAQLQIDQVSKSFPGGVEALTDVTLEVADGELLVLVGPSGCGKSTLLRIVAGLEAASKGRVSIAGNDVTQLAPRQRDVAMVFQDYALYPHMTVQKNMAFALRKRSKDAVKKRVSEVAEILEISDLLDRKPRALSGGQRQRVAMGRAIVRDPAAYLMDEPLSNLDAKLRVTMRAELIRLHNRMRTTTIYVTHDQVEAMTLGDRVAVLNKGRVLQCASPRQLFAEPANVFVASFIGSPPMNVAAAEVDGGAVHLSDAVLPVPPAVVSELTDRHVVLGIRPNALALPERHRARERCIELTGQVELVEDLGSELHVSLDFGATLPKSLSRENGSRTTLAQEASNVFVVRLEADIALDQGDRVTLVVDPGDIHYFDASTGQALAR